jgi:hypothetical protein
MKLFLCACSLLISFSGFSQLWHLSVQPVSFAVNDLMAKEFYISVADNNGLAVRGLKSTNFWVYGVTCPNVNSPDACIWVDLTIDLSPLEIEPGLYSILFSTKQVPHTAIKMIFLKVLTESTPTTGLPKFVQHAQILLQPAN